MNLMAALRECHNRVARVTAAVFAIGWLGFAVAPCQAMMPAPDDAPHHGSMAMNDCAHCPPAVDTAPDCADAGPLDCLAVAQPTIESRQADPPKPLAALLLPSSDSSSFAVPQRMLHAPGAAAPPPPRASLQQRYCSYLK